MKPTKKRITQKRVVVHLGNRGLGLFREKKFEKTTRLASRFRNLLFKGIDIREGKSTLPNWKQGTGDAIKKLKKFKDSSVNMISSDMFVGYYDKNLTKKFQISSEDTRNTYAKKILKLGYRKLKPKGTFYVTTDFITADQIIRSAVEAGFSSEKITRHLIYPDQEAKNSYWTKYWDAKTNRRMVKIRLEK